MSDTHQSSAAVFEHDHREIDGQFALFVESVRAGQPDPVPLKRASDDLRHHIFVEEEFHFPLARAAGLMGPVLVMLREHGQIWDELDRLEAAVAAGASTEDLLARLRKLETVLDHHNNKEEAILYPAGDQSFSPQQTAALIDALHGERRPVEWLCAYVGRT